jgi:hypothetical protein
MAATRKRDAVVNIVDLRSWVGVHSNQAGQVWELTWECIFGRRGFGEQRIQLGGTLFAGRHSGFARPASPWSSLTTQPRHESAPRLEGTFDGGTVCRTVQRLHSGRIEYPHRHPPTRQLYHGLAETTDANKCEISRCGGGRGPSISCLASTGFRSQECGAAAG